MALFESAPFMVALVDHEKKVLAVNPHTERLLGYTKGALNKIDIQLLLSSRDTQAAFPFNVDPAHHQECEPLHVLVRAADGQELDFRIGLIPVTPPGGQPESWLILGAALLLQDDFEAKLKESQAEYRKILSNLKAMSYRAKNDHNWTFEHVSEGSVAIFDIEPKDFLNGNFTPGELVHPNDIASVREHVEQGLSNRRQIQHEFRIITPKGNTRWVLEKCHGVYDSNQNVVAIEGLIIDITESKELSERLRETEETLQSFIDNAPVAIAMFDVNMNYLAHSKRWLVNFNLEENVVGRNHYDVFPNLPKSWYEAHKAGLSGKIVKNSEDLFVRADGREQWVRWEIHPWLDAQGEVGGIMLFSEDITEQKAASAERERISHALDAALDGIFMLDPVTLKFFYVNHGATIQTEYTEAELLKMTPADLAPEFDIKRLRALFKGLIEGTTNRRVIETVHKTKSGQLIPVEVNLQFMTESSGKHTILAVARDRTEQVNITRQLKDREAILSAVTFVATKLLNAPSWEAEMPRLLEKLGTASKASRAYYFERHLEEAEMTVSQRYEWCDEGVKREINNPFYQNMPLEKSGFIRWGGFFNAGESVHGSIHDFPESERDQLRAQDIHSIAIFPIMINHEWRGIVGFDQCEPNKSWSQQELDAMQASASAIAAAIERSEAQQSLMHMNEELEKRVVERTRSLEYANRELEAFSYSVSHDLRAPLRAVVGFANILIEDFGEKLGEDGQRILRVIENNSLKMGSLIDDLIGFARIGKQDLLTHQTDMNALVRSVSTELNLREHQHLVLTVEDLPPARCDAKLIGQVLQNLMSNAMKYSSLNPTPKITISAEHDGQFINYHVQDNGVGFDMKYYDKLFGVFQRLHSNPEFEGTGIGLALVKRIIDKHGGRIWAKGRINEGATFSFSLPAA